MVVFGAWGRGRRIDGKRAAVGKYTNRDHYEVKTKCKLLVHLELKLGVCKQFVMSIEVLFNIS